MLNKLKQVQELWEGTSDVIDHWLNSRQAVIVEYCNLVGLELNACKKTIGKLPTPVELQTFCQHLVDYISEGHFKIYEMVVDKWKSTGFSPTNEINQTYKKIVLTTEPLLAFTDKYANVDPEEPLEDFDIDLSLIGEIIETRFEIEDRFIRLIADSLTVN